MNKSAYTVPDHKLYRKLVAERAARARRAEAVDKFLAALLGDAIVTLVAAYPLMLGLHGLGVSGPYWSCVFLVGSLRMTIVFLADR